MLKAFLFAVAAAAAPEAARDTAPSSPVATPAAQIVRPTARPAPAVKRNALIRVLYESGPLTIESAARALSSGYVGDRILVMNADSHKTFSAIVSGENSATVK